MSLIKKINFKKKLIIISIILIFLSIGINLSIKNSKVKTKEVSIDTVTKRRITETSTETGNIEPNYTNTITLNSSQKVLTVAVKEGDIVNKGDLLVLLDSYEYENELEKEKLDLENARLTLTQMINTGVDKDKSTSENSVSQAKYNVKAAQRKCDDLSKKYEQKKALFSQGAVSQNELDDAKNDAADAESALTAAKSTLSSAEVSLKDTDFSSDNNIAIQKNKIALIQKDIDNYQKKIDNSRIVSNIAGKVIKINVKENEFPQDGTEIIVADISQYKVSIDLNQYDAIKTDKNQKVNILIKGSSSSFTGTVTDINEYAENKTNSSNGNQENKVKITASIDNPTDEIKIGYEADVQFIFKEKEDCITIGFDSIKVDKPSNEKYVYVVNPNNSVSKKYIKTGIQSDYYFEVTDGLNIDEKYILNPPENINVGDLVTDGSSSITAANNK